jgi:pilus assembly protein CpaE
MRRAQAPPPPPPGEPSPLRPKPQGAKIIVVYSPKGGCGVTTIAVNLAVALREETKQRVALVDASFQFGDVGVMLNLPTHRSIDDVVGAKHEPDEDILNGVMATHSSGVKVLLAPPRPEMAELITHDHVRSILNMMQKMFDYIVIDTAKAINDVLLTLLDASEQIILVSTADIGALKNAKLFFEVTDALQYPPNKTVLLLNKHDGRSGINARDIEGNIKHKVGGLILRDDRAAAGSQNRGVPFVVTQRGSGISQSIFALARMVRRAAEPASVAVAPTAPTPAPTVVEREKPKRRGFLIFFRG